MEGVAGGPVDRAPGLVSDIGQDYQELKLDHALVSLSMIKRCQN